MFKPPTNPETAGEVERPNVAAIAAQNAVNDASNSSSEEKGEGSLGGIDKTSSSSHHNSSNSQDGQRSSTEEYRRSQYQHGHPQHDDGRQNQRLHDDYRASQEYRRTSRDCMASDAESLTRAGHAHSMSGPRNANKQQPWV